MSFDTKRDIVSVTEVPTNSSSLGKLKVEMGADEKLADDHVPDVRHLAVDASGLKTHVEVTGEWLRIFLALLPNDR